MRPGRGCSYCGREKQTDGHRSCDGCGAAKPKVYGEFCGYPVTDPEHASILMASMYGSKHVNHEALVKLYLGASENDCTKRLAKRGVNASSPSA